MTNPALVRLDEFGARASERSEDELLDAVFFALSDPVRRAILARLGEQALLVSQLAEPFAISLQSVSRHIQVLVRAGLVRQERTGRISRCRLDVGPIYSAAIWINRNGQQLPTDDLAFDPRTPTDPDWQRLIPKRP